MISKDKIDYLNSINSDYSRFILNVVKAFEKREDAIEKQIKDNIYNISTKKLNTKMINLDEIWADPYLYTVMRVSLDRLIELLEKASIEEMKSNPNGFCKKIIYNNYKPIKVFPDSMINIVDFIKDLDVNDNLYFYAKEINEESIFKADQITKALVLKTISSKEKRYSKLYDYVYDYLKQDFIGNNYCDFIDNKCIAQRHIRMYPWHFKNGCCYREFSKCKHFNKEFCAANCMACRLFSCPYLSKMNVTYYGREFLLFEVFLNKYQIKHMVYDFYKTKNEVIKAILKEEK